MFNLQANSYEIGKGVAMDLDMELVKIGITVTGFQIQSVSYPEEVARMQQKAAAAAMVGNVDQYAKVQMADAVGSPNTAAGGTASQMAGMAMGMSMASQMAQQMTRQTQNQNAAMQGGAPMMQGAYPKFCPNCGTPTSGSKFCSNCGQKLIP